MQWQLRGRGKAQGIRPVELHVARHAWATPALESVRSIKWVANQLGHSDPSITLRTYAHALPTQEGNLEFASFGVPEWHHAAPRSRKRLRKYRQVPEKTGAPERLRTSDLRFRKLGRGSLKRSRSRSGYTSSSAGASGSRQSRPSFACCSRAAPLHIRVPSRGLLCAGPTEARKLAHVGACAAEGARVEAPIQSRWLRYTRKLRFAPLLGFTTAAVSRQRVVSTPGPLTPSTAQSFQRSGWILATA